MCGGLGGFVLCHSKDIGSCKKNKAVSPFAMEAASSSILFRFHAINSSSTTTAAAAAAPSKFYYETPPRNSSYDPSRHLGCKPFFCAFPRIFNFPGKCLLSNGFTAFSSSSSSVDLNPSPELAVLLEVDGVLMDAFRSGNRQAFNVAFRKLGLDCANWTEPIYLDLVRKSAGDEERMLVLFFNRIGWPTALPTSEKGTFMKSVLREKKNALDEFMVSQSSSLRPGVEDFIDDASKDGIPMVILTAYGKSDEKIARSIVGKLGHERMSKIKIIGNEEVKQSFYGQLAFSEGLSSDLNEQLAKEARKAASAERQRIAEEVASMLKLSVELDTSSSESVEKIVAALRAGAEYAAVSVQNCILIAGSKSGVAGAEKIGMPCVVLRSSLTSRAEFPSAKAIMDGFGGADLTIAKLRNKRWSLDGFL